MTVSSPEWAQFSSPIFWLTPSAEFADWIVSHAEECKSSGDVPKALRNAKMLSRLSQDQIQLCALALALVPWLAVYMATKAARSDERNWDNSYRASAYRFVQICGGILLIECYVLVPAIWAFGNTPYGQYSLSAHLSELIELGRSYGLLIISVFLLPGTLFLFFSYRMIMRGVTPRRLVLPSLLVFVATFSLFLAHAALAISRWNL